MAEEITADVVIVGSGIAGALMAARLAAAGVTVAILEAGAPVDRADATQRYRDVLIRVPESPYPAVPQAMRPVTNDPDFWYSQQGPDKFKSTYLKVVGGTTWHWLAALTEQLPDPQNRVTLDPAEKDVYGVPAPRLAYRLGDYVWEGLAAARAAHVEIFARLGAGGIQHRPVAEGAGHIIGTARMGRDPRNSVVDRELRSHDHGNLFILGSAVFPTSGTANPTLTIAALSLRAVAAVKATLAG